MNRLPVICLMGPTAVGKTDLALFLYEKLATRMPVDIISVDSTMVYKGLDIGTGKPSADILEQIPHQLVDIREPNQIYTVADFCTDTRECIGKAYKQNKIPLLVGGTMMYFKALQNGLAKLPSSDPAIRDDLLAKLRSSGLQSLYQDLSAIDPKRASELDPNDTQRILRALEIFHISGQTMSQWLAEGHTQPETECDGNYDFINIILSSDNRAFLHKNIETRFHVMVKSGFIEEVARLQANPQLHADLPALRSCGYKQIWQYLNGNISKEQMTDLSIISTRQLAKRQLTWLRAFMSNGSAFDTSCYEALESNCREKIINSLLAFDLIERIV